MRPLRLMRCLVVLVGIFSFVASYGMAQPPKDSGNIYTKWITLALLGKNQSEIEYFFRNEKETAILQVKERIRFAVLENLRRSGLKSMIARISDADDFNVIINKILIEIRYAGMEHDQDLILSIKEEFGVEIENL
ncbi:MAG: hypothetical protein MJE63_19280 [Proteobacteria bacterium]|nr:hypothetical protein [Pseudomonadota bacterium]